MGISPWGITTVTGTGIFLVLSPFAHLPVSPPLLSLLVGSGLSPRTLDKHSQFVPSMAAEEKSLVGVLVCPRGLFFALYRQRH